MKIGASEQIKSLLKEGKESEISKGMILESLRDQGIRDLDSFAAFGLEAQKKCLPVPLGQLFREVADMSPEDARVELLFGSKAQKIVKDVTHHEPRVPFVHGDAFYKPSEMRQFNGRVLHWVWDPETVGNGFLKAVTDPDEFRAALFAKPASSGAEPAARHHVPGAGHTFHQHINFSGNVLSLSYRHAFGDLTQITMSGFWFWSTSWNDQISSLKTGSGPVTFGEHVMRPYLTGATLNFPANIQVPWIGQAWNDRVSAILG